MMTKLQIYYGDNLKILKQFEDASFDFIYIDPPFNTGKKQKRGEMYYEDKFDNFIEFIKPRLEAVYRLLNSNGSFFLHIDPHESHYCKVLLDQIFGRKSFINEIIWAYDYGGRSKTKWSSKHDTIFWYAKDPNNYTFNFEEMDRIPYMAPGLVGKEKAARGKTPTDVFWHTIVPTNGKEKTGYPTQKPLGVLKRIVSVHSKPGDALLDFFSGSGSFGEAAALLGCNAVMIDNNIEAVKLSAKRLSQYNPECIGFKQ